MDLAAIKAVYDIVAKERLRYPKYVVTDGSEPQDGYLGVHKIVSVLAQRRALEFFVKLIPIYARSDVACYGFHNEHLFYTVLYPHLLQFQLDRAYPLFKSVPYCYKAVNIEMNEAIVLENLRVTGYSTFSGNGPMSKDHIELVLQQFGYFHATCFAFRDKHPNVYNDIIEKTHHPFKEHKKDPEFTILYEFLVETAKQALVSEDERIWRVFHEFSKNIGLFLTHIDSLKTHQYSIITHTDVWRSNLMFKYADSTNRTKPTDLRIVDWQMVTAAPPVIDVAYFFYTSSSKADMDMLDYYLGVYYSHLAKYTEALGSSVRTLYPPSIFSQQWKEYSRYSLIFGLLVMRNIFIEKDEAVAMKNVLSEDKNICNAFMLPIRNEDKYKKRIRDLIVHFVESGFLE